MSEYRTVIAEKASAAPPDPRRWMLLAVVVTAQLLVVLDSTVVNIALPSAQQALHISDADRQWVVTAYTLTFGGLLLLGGRIADYAGRKRTFLVGLAGFAAASALCGAATGAGMLFAARGLQGVFGALLAPAALSLITVTFTEARERAKAFGVFGAVSGGGAAVGLLVGGVLTEYTTWRWCLFINVPVAAIAFALALPAMRESRMEGRARYDVAGALLGTGGLIALVYGFTTAANEGWASSRTSGVIGFALVLLIAFVLVETKAHTPLLPLRVVLDRARGIAYLASVLLGVGTMGMFLFMTFYLQQTLGYTALQAGIAYLPLSIGIVVTATCTARLLPRFGARALMTTGAALAAAAMLSLTLLEADSSYFGLVLPAFVVMSIGMGLVYTPMNDVALSGVDHADAGVASALVNTSQQIGGSLGTALLNTIFTTSVAAYLASSGPEAATMHGYHVAFALCAALLAVCAVLVWAFLRARPR
ncbi:DHA2 family efflux MFS transporter permease subunit [Lentzea tibetensis]|uniref:DHA2 family efflux MFS transporter permease subunit n=1 Tax=Lentzea tibetensis TaxID=2591470 RepID=A0A563EXG4_9PSEU|nr:MFS transporter [Lentzea tibetensis]TWP52252.1 DHA2 family efflux MFS transporter permease subunit [Lentzea tibetensis]